MTFCCGETWGKPVLDYRLLFLGPHGDFIGQRKFEAADDAAALHAARSIYSQVQTPHHGFELWKDRRCLYAARSSGLSRNKPSGDQ